MMMYEIAHHLRSVSSYVEVKKNLLEIKAKKETFRSQEVEYLALRMKVHLGIVQRKITITGLEKLKMLNLYNSYFRRSEIDKITISLRARFWAYCKN